MPTVATAAVTAVAFAALYAGHMVGDHPIQSCDQAAKKGAPDSAALAAGGHPWRGWSACAGHVATYTVTALVAVLAVAWRAGIDLSPAALLAGLAVSAVTHYVADRRTPLRRIADRVGAGRFYRLNAAGMNGACLLDLLCTNRRAVA